MMYGQSNPTKRQDHQNTRLFLSLFSIITTTNKMPSRRRRHTGIHDIKFLPSFLAAVKRFPSSERILSRGKKKKATFLSRVWFTPRINDENNKEGDDEDNSKHEQDHNNFHDTNTTIETYKEREYAYLDPKINNKNDCVDSNTEKLQQEDRECSSAHCRMLLEEDLRQTALERKIRLLDIKLMEDEALRRMKRY